MIRNQLFKEIKCASDKAAVLASTKTGLQIQKNGYGMKVNVKKAKVIQLLKKIENYISIILKNQVLE